MADANDPFDLGRFVDAQAVVYPQVVAELSAGEKLSHWMWFVFPQIAGLGHSAMARRYAIATLSEARAYLRHPLLGPRLRECTALVNAVRGQPLAAILGPPDDLKFHSSMTLFAAASDDSGIFRAALDRYCGGLPDPATLARIAL